MWADVKLVVAEGKSDMWGTYRQAVAVHSPSGTAPSTQACGTLSRAERGALIRDAEAAFKAKPKKKGKEES
jgi:hypothetical protein